MICIYHSKDLDGFTSAAIVKRKYPDTKFIGLDNGQRLNMEEIPEGEPIIMIDISIPMEEMEQLSIHSGYNLTWIDHHLSSMNDFREYNSGKSYKICEAVLRIGIAACELGWGYLYPGEPIPLAV